MSRRLEKVPSVQLKEADGTEPMCAAKELIDKDVNRMNIEGIDPLLAKGTVTEDEGQCLDKASVKFVGELTEPISSTPISVQMDAVSMDDIPAVDGSMGTSEPMETGSMSNGNGISIDIESEKIRREIRGNGKETPSGFGQTGSSVISRSFSVYVFSHSLFLCDRWSTIHHLCSLQIESDRHQKWRKSVRNWIHRQIHQRQLTEWSRNS